MHSLRFLPVVTAAAILAILAAPAVSAQGEPLMPHLFYGRAFVGDAPAPAGTAIEARGPGIATGVPGNPVFVGEDGRFGGPGSFDEKLIVSGNIPANTPIHFTVGGARALCRDAAPGSPYSGSYPYTPSEQTELVLLVEGPAGGVTPTISATTPASTGATGASGGGGGGRAGSAVPAERTTGEPAVGTQGTVPVPGGTPVPASVTAAGTLGGGEEGIHSTAGGTGVPPAAGENAPGERPRGAGDPVPLPAIISLGVILALLGAGARER